MFCFIFAITFLHIWYSSQGCSPEGAYFEEFESGCRNFLTCFNGAIIIRPCPSGLLFNLEKIQCDWPSAVKCSNSNSKTSKETTIISTFITTIKQKSSVVTSTTKISTSTLAKTASTKDTTVSSTTKITSAPSASSITTTVNTKKKNSTSSPGNDYLITEQEFINAVVTNSVNILEPNSTAKCPLPSYDKYLALVSQAESKGGMATKQHIAMFLAQILWESDCLRAKDEYACKNGCPNSYPNTGSGYPGRDYHGRGYIQLTWDYNYRPCSYELYGDDRLLKNPELVATDENYAWATAMWFWKTRVAPRWGVQKYNFGDATMAINGGWECSGPYQYKAKLRYNIYKNILIAFNMNNVTPIEYGCYN